MATFTKSAKIKNRNFVMVRFPREGFIDGPFMKFMMDRELKNIFFAIGPCSFVVLEDSIPLLKSKGLNFRVIKPVPSSKLTKEQRMATEKGKAKLAKFNGVIFFFKLPVQ